MQVWNLLNRLLMKKFANGYQTEQNMRHKNENDGLPNWKRKKIVQQNVTLQNVWQHRYVEQEGLLARLSPIRMFFPRCPRPCREHQLSKQWRRMWKGKEKVNLKKGLLPFVLFCLHVVVCWFLSLFSLSVLFICFVSHVCVCFFSEGRAFASYTKTCKGRSRETQRPTCCQIQIKINSKRPVPN